VGWLSCTGWPDPTGAAVTGLFPWSVGATGRGAGPAWNETPVV